MIILRLLIITGLVCQLAVSLPNPVYTIHYLRSFRKDLIMNNFGCGHSIAYGIYLYPQGPTDALFMFHSPNTYGEFTPICARPLTYAKLFGETQDYKQLASIPEANLKRMATFLKKMRCNAAIIDWKHLPDGEERNEAYKMLANIISYLKENIKETVILKAPASYFCARTPNGQRFILDQNVDQFIIELYGEEPGKYTTFEQVFGEQAQQFDGYGPQCPKYPTRPILNGVANGRTVSFEKTLDPTQPGFVGSNWQRWLQGAGPGEADKIYFYDGFPNQEINF